MEEITLYTRAGDPVVFRFGVSLGDVLMQHPTETGLYRHRFTVEEARVVIGMLQHQVDVILASR